VQYTKKTHRMMMTFLMLFGIVMSGVIVVILSHNAFAQSLEYMYNQTGQPLELMYNQTLYERIKETSGVHHSAQIGVGDSPQAITASTPYRSTGVVSTVYVANSDSDTVSVISTVNNTKIKDIAVGDYPTAIGIATNSSTYVHTVYVANRDSDTVSVISTVNNTKIDTNTTDPDIDDIAVGDYPTAIGVSYSTVYVVNQRNNSVSVINATTNTKIGEDIAVGDYPTAIDFYDSRGGVVYVANGGGSVSIISDKNYTKIDTDVTDPEIDDIAVVKGPEAIAFFNETAYVVNNAFDYVSIISVENNTKIDTDVTDPEIDDIAVGKRPVAIAINEPTNTVYVVNQRNNSVSVINATTNTKIGEDIAVGDYPTAIDANRFTGTVYVANRDSDTVSVISAENNTKIKDIPVGDGPSDIDANIYAGTVYVANRDSDTVSVIDGITNKVVAGVRFQINPFNSGYILCDGLTTPSPIEQHMYVFSGAQCIAKPNEGFEFASWEENLGGNSTQMIKVSRPASPLDSFLRSLHLIPQDKPEATLNITKFGDFTANFREAPPALPPEYWTPLYGIIVATVVGWSIPSIIGWAKSKRDVSKLDFYHKEIARLDDDGRLDENDIEALDLLRNKIGDAYSEGKLTEKHYESLKVEISTLYEEIFRKKIATLDSSNNNYSVVKKPIQEQLAQIRNEIKYAFSKGKLNEKHYVLLNEDILKLDGKESDNS
jgi:YVTN family beta-propeller protein